MKWVWYYGCFFAFALGLAAVIWWRLNLVRHFPPAPLASPVNLSFTPPSLAETLSLTGLRRAIQISRRDGLGYVPLASGSAILQGESVAAGRGSSVKLIWSNGEAELGSLGEVSLVDTIPAEFLLAQINGSVIYAIDSSPADIRVGISLLHTQNAAFSVAYDLATKVAVIRVTTGSLALAYEDTGYTTHTLSLSPGQRVTVYGKTRTAKVTGR